MAYQNNIPDANTPLNVSQGDLKDNFAAIQTLIEVNHVTFGASGEGKHKFVSFPQQGSVPATSATEVALFSQLSTLTGSTELAIIRDDNATIYEFTSCSPTNSGWTRLPSGILLKWGSGSATGATTVNFPTGATIPAFSSIFSVQVTTYTGSGNADTDTFIKLSQFNTTSMQVYGSQRTVVASATVPFQYLAIGI